MYKLIDDVHMFVYFCMHVGAVGSMAPTWLGLDQYGESKTCICVCIAGSLAVATLVSICGCSVCFDMCVYVRICVCICEYIYI